MKICVAYRSKTGHSKKLAKAVGEELGVEPIDIAKNPSPQEADIMFLVGGIYGGKSTIKMLDYALNVGENVKNVALITSSASDKEGQTEIRAALRSNGIKVLDEYRCLGSFLFLKMGRPNQSEISGAREFAKRLVENLEG